MRGQPSLPCASRKMRKLGERRERERKGIETVGRVSWPCHSRKWRGWCLQSTKGKIEDAVETDGEMSTPKDQMG